MKKINETIPNLTQQSQSQTPPERKTIPYRSELPVEQIDRFFARMIAIYGHKFRSLFPDAASYSTAKQEWSRALAPLTGFQISRGLEACKHLAEWNPNIPEFIRYACNLPSKAQCVSRVINKNCIDLVSYRVYADIGSYRASTLSEKELKREAAMRYEDVYPQTLVQVMGNDEMGVVNKKAKKIPKNTQSKKVEETTEEDVFGFLTSMKRALKGAAA